MIQYSINFPKTVWIQLEYTSVCFNELPDQVNTKVVGAKASYILYDLEIFTWSDNTKTYNIINERPQEI